MGRPRVFVPLYFPFYGYDLTPNVIEVRSSAASQSSAEHVLRVGQDSGAPKPLPPADQGPQYVLIALRGGLIYAAESYQVDVNAFRFRTLQGDEYVIPLAELDLDFTERLNAERGVEFILEP